MVGTRRIRLLIGFAEGERWPAASEFKGKTPIVRKKRGDLSESEMTGGAPCIGIRKKETPYPPKRNVFIDAIEGGGKGSIRGLGFM